ncbi:universal stress protein [bacterium]|nr:universal stress protein [bacterium]
MHLDDRKILLALDGSEFSETAIETTVGLAKRLGAELHVVRVVPPLLSTAPELFPNLGQEFTQQSQAEAQTYLESLLPRFAGLKCQIHAPLGSPKEVISQLAQDQACRLVVMASHGRTGVARWLMGSTAEFVLRHVESTTLLLRPGALPSPSGEFQNVLVPVDGSASSRQVLGKLAPYLATGARVSVLRATGLTARDYTLLNSPQEVKSYVSHLEDQLRELDSHGLKLDYHVNDGEAADSIVHFAEQHHCDLIVMSTHGRTGFRRWILGSTTEKVARQAACPVLAFPAITPTETA